MRTVTIVTNSKKGTYTFTFALHESIEVSDRKIGDEFYKTYKPSLPGKHYELELLKMTDPIMDLAHLTPAQAEGPTKGKGFVCWTGIIPSEEEAILLAKAWSVGNTYTTENEQWFDQIGINFVPFENFIEGFSAKGFTIAHTE